jgi:membrane protein implicated in regulation of membrane protease activity
MSPWLWITAGILLMAAEIVAPGIYLLWIGTGALATGALLFVAPGLSIEAALIAFAAFALLAGIAGYFVYRRAPPKSDRPDLNRRADQLIGREFVLDDPIANGVGRARIDDTVWRVHGPDLAAGTRVRVTGSQSAVLEVSPLTRP